MLRDDVSAQTKSVTGLPETIVDTINSMPRRVDDKNRNNWIGLKNENRTPSLNMRWNSQWNHLLTEIDIVYQMLECQDVDLLHS